MAATRLPVPIFQVIRRPASEERNRSLLIMSLSKLRKARGNVDLQLILVSFRRRRRSSLLVRELRARR